MLVPPEEEPEDEWGDEDYDEIRCKVMYDFQGNATVVILQFYSFNLH